MRGALSSHNQQQMGRCKIFVDSDFLNQKEDHLKEQVFLIERTLLRNLALFVVHADCDVAVGGGKGLVR